MFLTMSLVFNTQFHIGKENIKMGLHKHHHYNTPCKQYLKNPLHCSFWSFWPKNHRSEPEHPMSSCCHAGLMDEGYKACLQSLGVTAGVPVTLVWNILCGGEELSESLYHHFGAWEPTGFRKWSFSDSPLFPFQCSPSTLHFTVLSKPQPSLQTCTGSFVPQDRFREVVMWQFHDVHEWGSYEDCTSHMKAN